MELILEVGGEAPLDAVARRAGLVSRHLDLVHPLLDGLATGDAAGRPLPDPPVLRRWPG